VRDNPDMPICGRCGTEIPREAHFCPTCGTPVAVEQPAEERKLATVVFADLVGSTALAGLEDPERTRALLERFYDAMAEEIERAGGTVEKFVGDAVMAAFGAPSALEDHAERALHAALAMQRRMAELFEGQLELRIGINTGDVVVGKARAGSSFVSGDAVNVGARLEQAAAAGDILVGERTAAAVRGAFELEEPVTIEAKGKPHGVVSRRLVRALSLTRPRGMAGLRQAFVGREHEFDELRTAYERVVREGRPRLLTLVGDAGVGKSRLARELWAWLAAQERQPVQRTGRCLSYGHGTAYWPLAEILVSARQTLPTSSASTEGQFDGDSTSSNEPRLNAPGIWPRSASVVKPFARCGNCWNARGILRLRLRSSKLTEPSEPERRDKSPMPTSNGLTLRRTCQVVLVLRQLVSSESAIPMTLVGSGSSAPRLRLYWMTAGGWTNKEVKAAGEPPRQRVNLRREAPSTET
jgi:class 3 adenylate cyclase